MNRRLLSAPAAAFVALVACGTGKKAGFGDAPADGGPGFDVDGGPALAVCKDGKVCVGNEIHACDAAGNAGAKIGECNGKTQVCIAGACQGGCAATAVLTSNVGCEFWAVDLDNNNDGFNNAAGQPWGLVISNTGDAPASVVIEQNDAEPGAPMSLSLVKKITVAPGELAVEEMASREVDGSLLGKNEGPGTMLSSRALRVRSTEPVVVYQFQPLRAAYSNDASLLLPTPSLGQTYRALSWPSGKPISIFGSPIDRGYVTVLGTQAGTRVSVTVTQAILAGGAIPATPKGGTVDVTLGPFDVLNLETDGMPGDLTGSVITSSAPVAVFVGTELSGGLSNPLPPPRAQNPDSCCLDHVDEQLLPVESYGRKFVIPRSPPRGTSVFEPDYIRFLGVAATADVKTNLPAPNDHFVLAPGQVKDILVTKDFTVDSTQPLAIGQVLVSQGYTEDGDGDPSLTIFPAIDQYRQDYLFLTPPTWNVNYVVIAMPEGTKVTIDGAPLPAGCTSATSGILDGVSYVTRRCPLQVGAHAVAGDKPFCVAEYGYGNAGSYAVVGGSNVKKIYVPPPIK